MTALYYHGFFLLATGISTVARETLSPYTTDMPTTIETKVFTLAELIAEFGEDSRPVKRAYNWLHESASYFWDHDYCIDHMKEVGGYLGIDVDKIYYSGFYSQGDGAVFEGTYHYKPGAHKAIRKEFPQWTAIHRIADDLLAIQRRHFYRLSASIRHNGRYLYLGRSDVNVYHDDDIDVSEDTEREVLEVMRAFCHEIFTYLREDYEYRTSREALTEDAEANEYTFDEDGRRFG